MQFVEIVLSVPLEPTILLERCRNLLKSCRQEPTLGSIGTDHFEQHSHKFVDFYLPPRALFIILNKARGTPRSDPLLEFKEGGGFCFI